VALTALVLIPGCGTGIAMAAASSGGSSSGAAWKYASAIAASMSALRVRIPVEKKQMRVEQLALAPERPDEQRHGRDVEQQTSVRENCPHPSRPVSHGVEELIGPADRRMYVTGVRDE
jgi:hypothetical protein